MYIPVESDTPIPVNLVHQIRLIWYTDSSESGTLQSAFIRLSAARTSTGLLGLHLITAHRRISIMAFLLLFNDDEFMMSTRSAEMKQII